MLLLEQLSSSVLKKRNEVVRLRVFLIRKMCLDCRFGKCMDDSINATICICDDPYTQSREFFDFSGFECQSKVLETCLPCDTLSQVQYGMYVSGFVLNLLIVCLMISNVQSRKAIRRNAILILAFVS